MKTTNSNYTNNHSHNFLKLGFAKNECDRFDLSTTNKGRIIITIVVFFSLVCTTGLYFGWYFFIDIFERNQAYHWLCENVEDPTICPQQKAAIQFLFSCGQSSHFFLHIVAAIMKDIIGPKRIAIIACCMFFSGFTMVAFSNEFFEAYIPGFILFCGSNDFSLYAGLSLVTIYPKRTNLVMGLCLGASFMSNWIPSLLNEISKNTTVSFTSASLLYLYLFALPCYLCFILLLPTWKFSHAITLEEASKCNLNKLVSQSFKDKLNSNTKLNTEDNIDTSYLPRIRSDSTIDSHDNNKFHDEKVLTSSTEEFLDTHSTCSTHNESAPQDQNSALNKFPIIKAEEDKSDVDTNAKNLPNVKQNFNEFLYNIKNPEIYKAMFSSIFLMFCVYWIVNMLRFQFFQHASREIYGLQLTLLIGMINPVLAPTSCLIYGYIFDKYGFTMGTMLINTSHLLLHVFFLISSIHPNSVVNNFAIVLWPLCMGNAIILLAFTRMKFSHIHYFCILNGICYILGGFTSFISAGFFSISVILFDGNFIYVCVALVILSTLLFPYLIYLINLKK